MTKSLMIIGAGPGIGQATAQKFGREGWTIVLSGRNTERLAALTAELQAEGITAYTMPADATNPEELRAAIAHADQLTGGLAAIHFNAAVVRQQDLFSMTDTDVETDLAINIAGGLHTIRAAVKRFGKRGGTILVTGGGLGVIPHSDWASLGIGKAAMRNVVQGLAGPLAEHGIRIAIATVNTLVAPGSEEAGGVAETFWTLATDPQTSWEAAYPPSATNAAPLTVIARLTAQPGQSEALGAALRALIAPTLNEDGAISYVLHSDNDDQNVYHLYETWRSQDDLDAHFQQPYLKAINERFPTLLAGKVEMTLATMIDPRG